MTTARFQLRFRRVQLLLDRSDAILEDLPRGVFRRSVSFPLLPAVPLSGRPGEPIHVHQHDDKSTGDDCEQEPWDGIFGNFHQGAALQESSDISHLVNENGKATPEDHGKIP